MELLNAHLNVGDWNQSKEGLLERKTMVQNNGKQAQYLLSAPTSIH